MFVLPVLMFSYQNLAWNCVAGESFEKSAWNEKKGRRKLASVVAAHSVQGYKFFVQKGSGRFDLRSSRYH